jgi:hypothetical protein
MRLQLLFACLLTVAPPCWASTLRPPHYAAKQKLAFTESLGFRIETAASGTNIDFSLPQDSVSESTDNASRTVEVISVDSNGLPIQFLVTYVGPPSGNKSNDQTASSLLGRTVKVDLTGIQPEISSTDKKALLPQDEQSVVSDARRFREYTSAITEFSALDFVAAQPQDLPLALATKLLGLPGDRLRRASVTLRDSKPVPVFDIEVALSPLAEQEGVDLKMLGTCSIKPDWTSLSCSLSGDSIREISSEAIQLRFASKVSIKLSRNLGKP